MDQPESVADRFIVAASAPRSAHPTGTLAEADAILGAHPEIASGDVYAAAILGDAVQVRELLAEDPARATARGGPYEWDALTYLCFSRYLRLRGTDEFVRAAEALLDAGADPNAVSAWGDRALHHSLARGNKLPLLEALLDAGADPSLGNPRHDGVSAHAIAARMGRADALERFLRRGFAPALDGDDAFFDALARADASRARALMPERIDFDVVAILAGTGNAPALSLALDLGLPLSEDALPPRCGANGPTRYGCCSPAAHRSRRRCARWPSARRPRSPNGPRTVHATSLTC